MSLSKDEIQFGMKAMILGVENKVRKSDGKPFRLIRFSDEAGHAHEAVEHNEEHEYTVFAPMDIKLRLAWGESKYGPYVNLTMLDAVPLQQ